MFRILGNVASRYWAVLLAGWLVLFGGIHWLAPSWDSVVQDGEFRYMPEGEPSRKAERLFEQAFSRDLLGSSVVLVVSRERGSGLTNTDRSFIENTLEPRLEDIARSEGGLAADAYVNRDADKPADKTATHAEAAPSSAAKPLVVRVRTESDPAIGHLLKSRDNKASLVIIELSTEFMENRNAPLIGKIERLVGNEQDEGELFEQGLIPGGLSLKLSGSATVGRDMREAARQSAHATERWTIGLVVTILILIYRAPMLAFIPLITVAVARSIALSFLSMLAKADVIHLFSGVETYVTVVLYGAGVDFCVFLMARYKEDLDAGNGFAESISGAVRKVGAAISASAGTTMCGIGMMAFAEFGKFQQAGIAMSLSLFFVLAASLTFTPPLLRLAGRWAFWPHMRSEQVSAGGWLSPSSLIGMLMERNWFSGIWDKMGRVIMARPMTVWLVCILAMTPFAVFGITNMTFLSYGLLSELPDDNTSVQGAKKVQEYFPAGVIAPMTALLVNRKMHFDDNETGIQTIRKLTEQLERRRAELGIVDILSLSHPQGLNPPEGAGESKETREAADKLEGPLKILRKGVKSKKKADRALEFYVSDKGELAGHVTPIVFVLENDPFSRDSINQFDQLKQAIFAEVAALSNVLAPGSELHYVGATANIRDLKSVTGRDQIRVDSLVMLSVFLVLVVLLRRPAIAGYLIVSVFFSYLVTLGVTFAVFWSLDPAGFAGLDWKVPMFLFTILIAVGEDYNIYLMTRVDEEQLEHGPVDGVPVALSRTGGIISSCGVIMAGTFASLAIAGTLEGMSQLGFALAFGVLLDTFVVRPILVPAYLVLLHSGRFGAFGRILGAQHELPRNLTPALRISSDPTDGQSASQTIKRGQFP